jgi:hypothetical protein
MIFRWIINAFRPDAGGRQGITGFLGPGDWNGLIDRPVMQLDRGCDVAVIIPGRNVLEDGAVQLSGAPD